MTAQELKQLVIDTGILLDLDPSQIIKLDIAISLAYNSGWLDAKLAHKKVCENSGVQECICHANKKVKGGDL